jgi:carboxylesterase
VTVDPTPFVLGDVGAAGSAVLCLHGLTGTPYEVRRPAEALADAGFACLGPALPGHLEPAERLAATPASAWLGAALDGFDRLAETHERVYVLGLSLGGLLALAIGARRPAAGLVVLAAPLRLRALPRVAVPLLYRWLRYLPKRPAISDPEARRRHPGTDRMPLRAVRSLMHFQRDVEGGLPQVTAPTHLVFSRRDPLVSPSNAERIRAGLTSTSSTVRYLERSHHVVTVDVEQEEVARECVSFFHQLDGGSRSDSLVDAEAPPP